MGSGQAGYRGVSAQVLAKVFEDGFGILGMFGGAILNAPSDIGVCHVFDHVDREFPAGYTGCGSDDSGTGSTWWLSCQRCDINRS